MPTQKYIDKANIFFEENFIKNRLATLMEGVTEIKEVKALFIDENTLKYEDTEWKENVFIGSFKFGVLFDNKDEELYEVRIFHNKYEELRMVLSSSFSLDHYFTSSEEVDESNLDENEQQFYNLLKHLDFDSFGQHLTLDLYQERAKAKEDALREKTTVWFPYFQQVCYSGGDEVSILFENGANLRIRYEDLDHQIEVLENKKARTELNT